MAKIYLDHISSTPLLPEVKQAMLPYLTEYFGNPSSLHDWGQATRDAIDSAREQVAALIGAQPEEITFTSNGTEANNLAVKGLALAQEARGKHLLASAVEHVSVLNAARALKRFGFELELIPVDKYGLVSPAEVQKRLRADTVLVSVMTANNEVGTLEPVAEIASLVRERNILFHTDAVCAAGNIPLNVKEMGIDALSLAGNQFYGPSGVGVLWLRRSLKPMPLLDGGFQENNRRAGSENVAGIVGIGKAAEFARLNMSLRIAQLLPLRDKLLRELPRSVSHTFPTGHPEKRLPGHASFVVEFVEGESMLLWLNSKGVAVSTVSSCTSKALRASHVLLAMGLTHTQSQGSLTFSLGVANTTSDVDYVLSMLPGIVDNLREMSPLYSNFVKGVA
jgi:cysteine desulfurase